MTARYPEMFAIDDSASIFCARLMRGTWSIARTVSLRAASRSEQRLVLAWIGGTRSARAAFAELADLGRPAEDAP